MEKATNQINKEARITAALKEYAELDKQALKEYAKLDKQALCELAVLKDNKNKLFRRRIEELTAVVDSIAQYIGVDDKGRYLYGILESGENPILDEMKRYLDNSGDKVKLKKRIAELENENSVLRTLINK